MNLNANAGSNYRSCLQFTYHIIREFIENLDGILTSLEEMALAHDEVTSRSNTLVSNCESLLEHQHSLHSLVGTIQNTLVPINNVEEFAHILGIPTDAYGNRTQNKLHSAGIHQATPSSDPRSSEFQRTINHITTAMKFLKDHPDLKDADLYKKWLRMLQRRAHSITTRNMLDLLNSAENTSQSLLNNQTSADSSLLNAPLESLPIYQKFRALGFRMRQLSALLPNRFDAITIDEGGHFDSNSQSSSHQDPVVEVRQSYVSIRSQLLTSFLTLVNRAVTPTSPERTTNAPGGLGNQMRQIFSYLLRIAHLEQQLFFALFRQTDPETSELSHSDVHTSMEYSVEVESILDLLCGVGISFLRPVIIREMSVDELCRVISALAEGSMTVH